MFILSASRSLSLSFIQFSSVSVLSITLCGGLNNFQLSPENQVYNQSCICKSGARGPRGGAVPAGQWREEVAKCITNPLCLEVI